MADAARFPTFLPRGQSNNPLPHVRPMGGSGPLLGSCVSREFPPGVWNAMTRGGVCGRADGDVACCAQPAAPVTAQWAAGGGGERGWRPVPGWTSHRLSRCSFEQGICAELTAELDIAMRTG